MQGAVHAAEPLWVNGRATSPREIRPGDEVEAVNGLGAVRRARVKKTVHGGGRGTVWLHSASGALIRCLMDERVAVHVNGRRTFRRAENVGCGDFLYRLVAGRLTVDPVVAVRVLPESVHALILEIPPVSLVSEEGLLCRPS